MKNLIKTNNILKSRSENVEKSQKQDVNLQKNSTIYFQVGLIVCLLFSYGLLEMEFTSKTYVPDIVYNLEETEDYVLQSYEVYKEPVTKVEEAPKAKVKLIEKVNIIDNDAAKAKETPEIITPDQNTTDKPVAIKDVINVVEPVDPVTIPLAFVEIAPVFPGCETATTNEQRKACLSEKISKHIQKKFNTNIISDLGLEGEQNINVMFKIDANGNVTDIQARSTHNRLEKEAKEVISKLPKMTPGKQQNNNVSVIYGIPIKLQVHN